MKRTKLKGLAVGLAALFAMEAGAAATEVPMPEGETPLRITGTGSGSETRAWTAGKVDLAADRCYRVTFSHRKEPETLGTTLCTGVSRLNFDTGVGNEWKTRTFILLTGEGKEGRFESPWHFGLYNVKGAVEVKNLKRVTVVPRHAVFESGELGRGEMILANRYSCDVVWGGELGNYARALKSFRGRVSFNTTRWEFSGGGEMVFAHELSGRRFLKGDLTVRLQRYWRGSLNVDASGDDGKTWHRVGVLDANHKPLIAPVPEAVLRASGGRALLVRLTGASDASMQVSGYTLSADVDGPSAYVTGATDFVADGEEKPLPKVGDIPYYTDRFGERLPCGETDLALWRASSGWKVARTRKPPTDRATELRIGTAINEAEAVQLVVTPAVALAGVCVTATAPSNAQGAEIPLSAVDVLRVRYVNITDVVEHGAVRGLYPDPLPPQRAEGVSVAANESQPFWVRVKPPKGTAPGLYRGRLRVSGRRQAGGQAFVCEVPYEVEVFGFQLPDVMTCRTAFGLRGPIDKIHNAKTSAERRLTLDRYFKAMDDWHLSPYYPAARAGKWKVRWTGLDEVRAGRPEKAEPVFDWTEWDREMEESFSKYHFTSFRLDRELGLGVGASGGPGKVSLAGIPETDPGYEVMLAKYLGAVERHLKEKGWLDKALVYCFDEPRASDSEFVMRGFMRAKRYAPGLRRFLTAPVRRELVGGPDIWCPIFPDYDEKTAAERKAAGDEFWSYVCMFPRAPYATLFIEHPGVEMRTWLWQCRAAGMTGVLVWDTNNWMDRNPYETPMARNREGGFYGNGDGMFLYPPESAMEGQPTGFVDELPVGSVRGEMLRDGIEDYEYFALLQRLLNDRAGAISAAKRGQYEKLLEVPADVSRTPSDFSTDPAPLERHRRALAKAIADLSAHKPTP